MLHQGSTGGYDGLMPKRSPSHMLSQRERILRATIHCIGDVGLERTSIARICKEAGLSAGAIYKHFSGKDEIVAQALRFAAMPSGMLPADWPGFKTSLAAIDDQMGFDAPTAVRAQLQLLASSMRPGPLHEMVKPMIEGTLSMAADHLAAMERAGQIRLKLSPVQTAMCISALTDGLLWIGLATDRAPDDISADIAAGLDCLIVD